MGDSADILGPDMGRVWGAGGEAHSLCHVWFTHLRMCVWDCVALLPGEVCSGWLLGLHSRV